MRVPASRSRRRRRTQQRTGTRPMQTRRLRGGCGRRPCRESRGRRWCSSTCCSSSSACRCGGRRPRCTAPQSPSICSNRYTLKHPLPRPRPGAAQQCGVRLTRASPVGSSRARQAQSQRLSRLAVRLVLARELGGDADHTAKWLEQHVNRHIDPVRVLPDWPCGRRLRRSAVGLVLLAAASAAECACARLLRPRGAVAGARWRAGGGGR